MVELDDGEWPIVRISIRGTMSDAEMDPMLERIDEWIERRAEVTVLDCTEHHGVEVRQLKRMGRWLNSRGAVLHSAARPTVLVLQNSFLRAAADLVFKIAPQAGPVVVVRSLGEAMDRARRFVEAPRPRASSPAPAM